VQDCEQVSASVPKPGSQQASEPVAKPAVGFPRSARLLKHSDFDRVYKQGRRHFSSHMTVYYLCRPEIAAPDQKSDHESDQKSDQKSDQRFDHKSDQKIDSGARVGFTVGRVLGGAVDRNRIRRRLREAVRQRRAVLQGAPAVDVVINPKKSVLNLEFSLVLEEVGRAFDTIAKKLLGRIK
jgi:ribonuclease P protein component